MYEPETASICYCGHIIVSTGLPLKELVPGLLDNFDEFLLGTVPLRVPSIAHFGPPIYGS